MGLLSVAVFAGLLRCAVLVFPSAFFHSNTGLLRVRFVIASSDDGECFFSVGGALSLCNFLGGVGFAES